MKVIFKAVWIAVFAVAMVAGVAEAVDTSAKQLFGNDLLDEAGATQFNCGANGVGGTYPWLTTAGGKLYDNDVDTQLDGNCTLAGGGATLPALAGVYDLPQSYNLTGFAITIKSLRHNGYDFSIQGSTDTTAGYDGNWTTIYTHGGGDFSTDTTYKFNEGTDFTIAAGYTAYRISHPSSYKNYAEIEFFGTLETPSVRLSSDPDSAVATNAPPGSYIGYFYMGATNSGDFTYILESGVQDNDDFQITSSTNLRTAVFPSKGSYTITTLATNTSDGFWTNDTFTITVTNDTRAFVVNAEVQENPTNGTLVGTALARSQQGSISYAISSGRSDLFSMSGDELKVANAGDWGAVGTTNYVEITATDSAGSSSLLIAVGVVSTPSSSGGSQFLFW